MYNQRIYYKVVAYEKMNRKLYSAFVHTQITYQGFFKLRKLQVEYKIGQWVKPKVQGTKLCVFTNLDAARDYSISRSNPLIYTCYIRGKGVLPSAINTIHVENSLIYCVKNLWERWENTNYRFKPYECAVSAEEVKLIKLIDATYAHVNIKIKKEIKHA